MKAPAVAGQCTKCGLPSGKFKRCPACLEKNRIAVARFHGKELNGPKICAEEGCNEEIPPRSTFCKPCSRKRKLSRDRKLKAQIHKEERFGLKPHRPEPPPPRKQPISEEEQARLDAEASRRDRQWHAQFMKQTLGLESAPGQPLASKVVRPPPEVFKQLEAAYRPLREGEKEFHLPLRADILY